MAGGLPMELAVSLLRTKHANRLLAAFAPEDLARIEAHLRYVELPVGEYLERAGEKAEFLFFIERGIASGLAFLRRRISGEYEVDEFGYDPDFNEHVLLPAARALYERWFRVETAGVENVPAEGGALIVANHSGTVPLDALMLSPRASRELETAHRRLINLHLEKELKSARVLREMRQAR